MEISELAEMSKATMLEAIGIEIVELGDGYVCGRMPVDKRTIQPFGLLHGGASAAFAETLGSVAGMLMVDSKSKMVVGKSLKCRHIRSVRNGWVYGKAESVEIGEAEQVWSIVIRDDQDRVVCSSRLTLAIVEV